MSVPQVIKPCRRHVISIRLSVVISQGHYFYFFVIGMVRGVRQAGKGGEFPCPRLE